MGEREVIVSCYWNACIKYGSDGVYYQGSTPQKISVKQKTEFTRLVDGLRLITGLDKFKVFGRYPVVVSPNLFTYVHFPVVDDSSLEKILEVPSIHPSMSSVELFLEVNPSSDDVINPAAACSSPLDNLGCSLKRQRIQQPREGNGYADMEAIHPPVKLDKNNGLEVEGMNVDNERIYDEWNADFGNGSTHGDGEMTDKTSDSDEVAQETNMTAENDNLHQDLTMPGLEESANECLNEDVNSNASKPRSLSSLWVDDHELRVGLCFKDKDELKKAVDWCTIRGRQKCVVREIEKDKYVFKCIRWKCNWSLCAARMEEHGLVEITKCSGPHTCCPLGTDNFNLEFAAEEIECLIRVQPTLTIDELGTRWLGKFGYELETAEMKTAKQEAIKKIYGDWDQSFRVLPKLMAALQSSNGLVVDWQYDVSPNPEFASFCGVFWAFSQSIEGFRQCRPLIEVDSKDLGGKYPMKLMIASGIDAEDYYFPLAFAVTKEVSSDNWRWFLNGIREKVTQRQGICLISSPHPDILAVINEPGSLWQEPCAYHRLCLNRLCSQFHDIFQDDDLKSLVEEAGVAMEQDEFDSYMEAIKKKNPKARRWLNQMHPHQWAFAHDGGRRYGFEGIDTKDFFSTCESFQSLDLPLTATVLLLFDEMRSFFLTALCDSKGKLECGDVYTKPVMDRLEEFKTASVTYLVMPLDNNAFKVTTPTENDGWMVQLSECTCICGEFQVYKFPCLHALAVCEKLKINPLQYVDDCHTFERYYKTYAATFSPVPEVSAWPEASEVPTLLPPVNLPLPPPPTKVSGKSKQKPSRKKRGTVDGFGTNQPELGFCVGL